MPCRKNIFAVEEVFDHIDAHRDELATLKGEFIDGKYMRVHRTIGSTRMDIKIAHARIENKIVNVLEPLATLARTLGFEYHHGLLEKNVERDPQESRP